MTHTIGSRPRKRLGPLLGTAVVTTWLNAADAATFIPLGDLPGGEFASEAYAVSDDGSVVVGTSRTATATKAFRWTADQGMVALDGLPGLIDGHSAAYDLSADGSVVVGKVHHEVFVAEAFRWTVTGSIGLGDLAGGDRFFSEAWAVSAGGDVVVGGGHGASGPEAFRWTSSDGMVGLGDLVGLSFDSGAEDVSADGSVVVGTGVSVSGFEAYRWTAASGMVGLGDLEGGVFESYAKAVSADGEVVVGESASASGPEAFRWTASDGMAGIGDLPGGIFRSAANGVSADGNVIVGRAESGVGAEAFIWTQNEGMQSLRDVLVAGDATGFENWVLDDLQGVSRNGRWVVGSGTNAFGFREAFLANVEMQPIDPIEVSIRAFIDGRSRMLIQGNELWWHHYDFAAPGLETGTDEPTVVNDYVWAPVWPFDGRGDGCDCDSSRLDLYLAGVQIPVEAELIEIRLVDARGGVVTIQEPSADNAFLTILEFDDNAFGGAAWYEVIAVFGSSGSTGTAPIDHIPTAVDDTAEVESGSELVIDALANDLGLADAPITVSILRAPANGTAMVRPDNQISFTADVGFSGDASFSYAVTDLDGDTASAMVTVAVTAPAPAPGPDPGPDSPPDPDPVIGPGTGGDDGSGGASPTSGLQPPPVVHSGGGGGTMSPLVILLLILVRLSRHAKISASGVAVLLLTSIPLPVRAQAQSPEAEPPPARPETIIVIGSHIDGIDPEGLAPTVVIDRVEIELSGNQTVGELLEQLPMNNGGTFNDRDALASSRGGTAISFRGLGPSAVLLLLNGRRMTTYGFPHSAEFGSIVSFVDANNIPLAAVERIEILKDGASALYGSEAHAGVINIVLRDSFVGTEAELRLGASDATGADEESVNVLHGWVEPRTSIRLIASHTDREQLAWSDRAISASADHESRGGIDQRSLAATNFDVDGIGLFGAECEERNTSPDNRGFTEVPDFGICLYDPNREIVVPSATRSSLMALVDREVGEQMLLRLEASYQTTEATGRRDPISWSGAVFPAANPWNPFGQDVLAEYRFTEFGPRIDTVENDASRAVLALQGDASGWDWEFGIMHHSSVTENAQQGYLNADRVEQALNGVDLNGNGQLEAAEYWNLYSPASNPNSLALANSLAASTLRRSKTALTAYNVNFSGMLGALRYGNLRAAFGAEERRESLDDRSDPISLGSLLAATTVQRNWFGMNVALPFDEIEPLEYVDPWEVQTGTVAPTGFSGAHGSRSLRSAFGELLIPLLPRLELQTAVRLEGGDDLDVEIVPRVALRYDPTARIRLKSSWGEGYRAPSLAELHAGPSTILQSSWDPRRCPEEGFLIPESAGGCVVRSFVTAAWGNPNLVPETSESFNVSVEFDLLDKHSMAVDCWNTDIGDKIVTAQTAWFIRHELDLPEGFIVRDPLELDDDVQSSPDPEYPGAIAQINVLPLNFGGQKAKGCDVELSSIWNGTRVGDSVEASVIASHTASNELTFGLADTAEELTGSYGYPRNRMNLNLIWRATDWRIGLTGRWTDGFDDSLPGNDVSSHVEWDAQLAYAGFGRTQISVGVENILDTPPPFSAGAFHPQGFPIEFYDMRGRFIYAQIRATLGDRRLPASPR